jgi:hypothetical protein
MQIFKCVNTEQHFNPVVDINVRYDQVYPTEAHATSILAAKRTGSTIDQFFKMIADQDY